MFVASSVFGVVLVAGFFQYAHVKRPQVLILNARAPNLGVREFPPGDSRFSELAVLPPGVLALLVICRTFYSTFTALFLN